jgi:hypothetical protein
MAFYFKRPSGLLDHVKKADLQAAFVYPAC